MTLMTRAPADGSHDFKAAFESAYQEEFGFLMSDLSIVVDDVRVRGIGKTFESLGETVYAEVARLTFSPAPTSKSEGTTSMYFETGRVDVPIYLLSNLEQGDSVQGPGDCCLPSFPLRLSADFGHAF